MPQTSIDNAPVSPSVASAAGDSRDFGSSDNEIDEPKAAMSTKDLSDLCFPPDLELSVELAKRSQDLPNLDELRRVSIETNQLVIMNTESRQGRNLQRFSVVPATHSQNNMDEQRVKARLTTGTVPILNDGRILLVSSKSGWILPKGGWEQDEALPKGAIRETFEEAGIVGLLGPQLPLITYETRKALKRRIASTDNFQARVDTPSTESSFPVDDGVSAVSSSQSLSQNNNKASKNSPPVTPDRKIPSSSSTQDEEHTHNCMAIFPLFVQQVYEEWPEKHRLRLAVSVEEAHVLLSGRPQFRSVLDAVKEYTQLLPSDSNSS